MNLPTSRVVLSPGLPPQTEAYRRFEERSVEINRFYWVFRVSLEYATKNIPPEGTIPSLFSDSIIAKSLNIPSHEFISEAPNTERVARNSMLILAITAHEEYLNEVLTSFLIRNWKLDKNYKITFRPDEIPAASSITDWLKERSIKAIVDEYINKSYSSRFDAISSLISSFNAQRPILSQDAKDLGVAACEARNCIIHTNGVIDLRTKNSLQSYLPAIREGDILNFDESLLWKFLGAIRDSTRSIDVALR